ncbi:site-specific integrase [Methylobacterium organophilum]|uniref:tyrosine-type recombinase/integrase n=1 Tax=Methylobacterium organophilum TaxID=410 RepID=UPI001F136ACB|nr:site-specific integrase [Methylobacterium organophilum]UMY19083.1 site-specific integrase [Methylobacterium organophilum]
MPRPAKGARLYYRRKDDRWVIKDTGAPELGTGCSYGERDEAERQLQAHLAKKHRPEFGRGDPAEVSVLDVLTHYATARAPQLKRGDITSSALPHLGTFFQGKKVAHLTPDLCRAYATWRSAQPQARFKVGPGYRYQNVDDVPRVGLQTARRELAVLSSACGFAHKEHKLLYPVVITLPDKAPPRDRWLTRDEAAHMIWAALGFRNIANDPSGRPVWRRPRVRKPDGTLRAELDMARHVARFILVGLYTGTRHDAILRLKWLPTTEGGYVDLRSGIIYRRGLREGESSKKRTPVPMSRRLWAHMRRWQPQSVSHVIEFEGLPLVKLRRAWNTARIAARLGEEVTPHILRHTFATWAVMDGVPFGKVAQALGTTEMIVQDVYGHHAPEHLRSVVESVSRRR